MPGRAVASFARVQAELRKRTSKRQDTGLFGSYSKHVSLPENKLGVTIKLTSLVPMLEMNHRMLRRNIQHQG
jgi:hypothetical protein